MVTTDGNPVFVDTNVLVYTTQLRSPWHLIARQTLGQLYAGDGELWISRQVLREYLAVLTRSRQSLRPPPVAVLIADVHHFMRRFHIAEDGPAVTERLLALVGQHAVAGNQVHDANIVATMLTYDIHHILTHNIADFSRFSDLVTVLPLDPDA